MKSLVAEDSALGRTLLHVILQGYGPCDCVENGAAALRMFTAAHERKSPYDLVCLDIIMPDMDGQETLKCIRQWESAHGILGLDGVRVIMMTAMDDSNNIMTAFRSQCEGYLVKPIQRRDVIAKIEDLHLPKGQC